MSESVGRGLGLDRLTLFFGSFLLFLIQPLVGRTLLPLFGGSAAVWGVCLAVYQVLLLCGYFYAHSLSSCPEKRQRVVHGIGLVISVAWIFLFAVFRKPLGAWMLTAQVSPWLCAAGAVLFCIGIPYLLLSAGSSLMQSWLARLHPNVYKLYAWSNIGSFLGLLCYPFLFEPYLSLSTQWFLFGGGLFGYFLLVCRMALRSKHGGSSVVTGTEIPALRKEVRVWTWIVLPGATSFLLNAVVAHLFMDVSPLPLVWVVMLSAFLLSYSWGFTDFAARHRWLFVVLGTASLFFAAIANGMWGTGSFYPNAAAGFSVLLFVGTALHGWLYAERPEAARLTRYYLGIAVGGAVGGLMATFVAPLLFTQVSEYPLGLCLSAFLLAVGIVPHLRGRFVWGALAAGACFALLFSMARRTGSRVLFRGRNFYGTLAVTRTVERLDQQMASVSYLWYGQTTHGLQVNLNELRRNPYSYYTPGGGGAAVLSHPKYLKEKKPMTVGVIGLGVGALSAYGRPEDLYRFFEINPMVIDVARDAKLFTYLRETYAKVDLILGDARRMLEIEIQNNDPLYDVLYVDAYSGDSVPYHLITREAFEVYLKRLKPDGILAVHVSNWHIDLLPLCKGMAESLGLYAHGTISREDGQLTAGAVWVYFTRNQLGYVSTADVRAIDWSKIQDFPAPTDEKGSLLPLLRGK